MLLPGMIVVEESLNASWFGKLIIHATKSNWTHAWIVGVDDELIEAMIGHGIRRYSLSQRLAELKASGKRVLVLDAPELTDGERMKIVAQARTYIGRKYDLAQCVWYAVFGHFIKDGTRRMVCSRLCTAAWWGGIGRKLFSFDGMLDRGLDPHGRRFKDLLNGYATPADLATLTDLTDVTARANL